MSHRLKVYMDCTPKLKFQQESLLMTRDHDSRNTKQHKDCQELHGDDLKGTKHTQPMSDTKTRKEMIATLHTLTWYVYSAPTRSCHNLSEYQERLGYRENEYQPRSQRPFRKVMNANICQILVYHNIGFKSSFYQSKYFLSLLLLEIQTFHTHKLFSQVGNVLQHQTSWYNIPFKISEVIKL